MSKRSGAHGSWHREVAAAGSEAHQRRAEADQTLDELSTFHSIPAVAKRLDVSEKSVRRHVERGRLRAYKIGGQIRISEPDLRAFLLSCRLNNR